MTTASYRIAMLSPADSESVAPESKDTMKRKTMASTMAALLGALIVGCGGGGGGGGGADDTPTPGSGGGSTVKSDVMDKYNGTFQYAGFCAPATLTGYMTPEIEINKTGSNVAHYTIRMQYYFDRCTGKTTNTMELETGTMTCDGTKLIGSVSFDKCVLTDRDGPSKEIFAIRADGKLVVGDESRGLDAEGYPIAASATP